MLGKYEYTHLSNDDVCNCEEYVSYKNNICKCIKYVIVVGN